MGGRAMLAAILGPEGGLRLTEQVKPVPGPGEALIRVRACGVCSSDMSVYRTGLKEEIVLGHEVVGTVEALGEGALGPAVGARVTGAIMRGYAEYTLARAEHLIPVPDALSDPEAIVEPLSCMLSGIRRAGCAGAERAVIVGAGFMGLALIALTKAAGVGRVEVCDVSPEALIRAKAFGADAVHLPDDPPPPCAFVFETAGSQGAITWCGELAARLGTLTIVGYHPLRREIDMGVWAGKALTVINAFEYDRGVQLENMRYALELAERGELPLRRLFTHSFPLHQVDRAFQTHLNRPEGFIKGLIRMDGA